MLIVTGSDDRYVPGVLVLIESAAFHTKDVEFAVLSMGITEDNQARIRKLSDKLGVPINIIEVESDHFEKFVVRRSHLTRGAFLRLLIPDLFADKARALYMDCDMVVMGDLSYLATVDLGDAPLAAVPCPSPDEKELESVQKPLGLYFNSGLLVMNIPVWRSLRVSERCADLLSDPDTHLVSEDQSALNIVCRDNALLLPTEYNVYSTLGAYEGPSVLPEHPVVIHYVVNNKPWKSLATFGEIWQFHADRISELMPPRPKRTLGTIASDVNFKRKILTERLSGKEKHKIRTAIRKSATQKIIQPYLRENAAR